MLAGVVVGSRLDTAGLNRRHGAQSPCLFLLRDTGFLLDLRHDKHSVGLMKIIPIAALLALLLSVEVAAQTERETSASIGRPSYGYADGSPIVRFKNSGGPAEGSMLPGVGICLVGDKYSFIESLEDADKCDALMWADAALWAYHQRKLIDESTLAGNSTTTDDGATVCRSCSGTCQTVSLPIKDSNYETVETVGGQSPSECLAKIRDICDSGSYRHFASARCGN
jgi:hypothetical protein